MPGELDVETIAFAHRMVERARRGPAGELSGSLAQRLPVNPADDRDDTLSMTAAHHDHPLAAGLFFELPEPAALLLKE